MTAQTASASATPGRARRVPKSGAAAGAAQHANTEVLKDNAPVEQPRTEQTQDVELRMPHVQHAALVSSLKASMSSFKAAVNLEIAVCCAAFIEHGGTNLTAKKTLVAVYGECGYSAKVGGKGKDYKTVNRRINTAAAFFDKQPKDALKAAMGEARDEAAIQSLLVHVAGKFDFRTMQDVNDAAGIARPVKKADKGTGGTGGNNGGDNQSGNGGGNAGGGNQPPQGGAGGEPQGQVVFGSTGAANPVMTAGQPQPGPDAGEQGVLNAMKEAGEQRGQDQQSRRDMDSDRYTRFTFEGATVLIPKDMTTACLGQLGLKLAAAAHHMRGDRIDVPTLMNEFKEATANH
jgi:hypothetical protein